MPTIISPQQAKNLMETQNALLVDIREPDEYAREYIEGSRLTPLSVLPNLPPDPDTARPAIFFCQSGRRSKNNQYLLESRGFTETYLMEGGVNAWKQANLPVVSTKLPPAIPRQIQMVAGVLILLTLLLGLLHPAFLWLTAFIGAGLFLAGLTGVCLMARVLARMPWNIKAKQGKSCSR